MVKGLDRRKKQVYLSLGSNMGQRRKKLLKAIELIKEKAGKLMSKSSIYETESWGNTALPSFLNMVVQIETEMKAEELMQLLLTIEMELGRKRSQSGEYSSRSMDIDILYYNNGIISKDGLDIPHPHLHKRNFVLIPLVEIAPDFIHPILHKSNLDLLKSSTDLLKCKRTF